MTPKQKKFCFEYLVDLNATQAAIRAGYSEDTARSIGCENLTKPDIRSFIDEELKKHCLEATETSKLLSDIAKNSLNDFFVIREVEYTPKVVKPLSALIQEAKEELEFEKTFMMRAHAGGVWDKRDMKLYEHQQKKRSEALLRLELQYETNPEATKVVYGETVMIEVAELDLVKLVKAKETGRIKSFQETRFGPKVEMYAADGALRDIAKMHGLFEKDNDQKKSDIIVNVDGQDTQIGKGV